MNDRRLLAFAFLLGASACRSGELAPDGGAGATPAAFGCTPISESARAGCRSSDEPNCERCCLQTQPDSCGVWSLPCATVVAAQSVGQYCEASSLAGQCPADCRPCAACSKSSEASLCSLRPTIGACDCAHVDIGVDPCFGPQSCACLCATYAAALAACPP
jgi:hypothetical protein